MDNSAKTIQRAYRYHNNNGFSSNNTINNINSTLLRDRQGGQNDARRLPHQSYQNNKNKKQYMTNNNNNMSDVDMTGKPPYTNVRSTESSLLKEKTMKLANYMTNIIHDEFQRKKKEELLTTHTHKLSTATPSNTPSTTG